MCLLWNPQYVILSLVFSDHFPFTTEHERGRSEVFWFPFVYRNFRFVLWCLCWCVWIASPLYGAQLNALEIETACVLTINSQVAQLVFPAKIFKVQIPLSLIIKYITLLTVIKQTTKAYFSIYKLLDSLD